MEIDYLNILCVVLIIIILWLLYSKFYHGNEYEDFECGTNTILPYTKIVTINNPTERFYPGYITGTDQRLCKLNGFTGNLNLNPCDSITTLNPPIIPPLTSAEFSAPVSASVSPQESLQESPQQTIPVIQPVIPPQSPPQNPLVIKIPPGECMIRAKYIFENKDKLNKTKNCRINSIEDAYRWMSCRTDEKDKNGQYYCPPFSGNDCSSLGCDLSSITLSGSASGSDLGSGSGSLTSCTPVTPGTGTNPNGKIYNLTDNYQGEDFKNKFDFYTTPDKTSGRVNYAAGPSLCSFPVKNQKIQFRTDISSKPQTDGVRGAVRISSQKRYNGGLFVIDADHIPEGMTVWPAFWLTGPNWPCNGEIDIIENVNSFDMASSVNSSTLHTKKSCIQNGVPCIKNNGMCGSSKTNAPCIPCGDKGSTDCPYLGCGVDIQNAGGYAFNRAGGGVYACEWVMDGPIRIWYFPRNIVDRYIPQNATTVNTSIWPKPYVEFKPCPGSFQNNNIIINTTLCGDWAGAVYPGGISACNSFVTNPNNKYELAYWLINYVKVFD